MPDLPIPTKDGFRADLVVDGKRIRKLFTRARYSDPYIACKKYLDTITNGNGNKRKTGLLTDIEEYHRWSEADKKKAYTTVVNYRHMLGEISAFLIEQGVTSTEDITVEHIRAYRTAFTQTNRGDNTWGKYRQALSAFINWAKSRDRFHNDNPAAAPEFKIKFQTNAPETFDPDEIKTVLAFIDQDDKRQGRAVPMGTLFRFLFLTGARLGEALKLTWNDVDLKGKTPAVSIGTKTKIQRTVPLHPDLIPELKALRGAGKVFPYTQKQVYGMLQKACHLNDLPHHTVHGIRHTFARMLFENNADINLVSKLMGHLDIRTTMIYAQHFSLDRATNAVSAIRI